MTRNPRPLSQSVLLLSLALLPLALAGLGGCVSGKPIDIHLPSEVRRPERAVVILLADGLSRDVVDRLRAEGKLPNMQRCLYDRGVQVEQAVTTVPSITFAANVSLVTGQFPGHHGITGNRWFDRDQLRLVDYDGITAYLRVNSDFIAPTLFEAAGDLYSVTILLSANRGATRVVENWLSAGLTWFFGTPAMLDALTADRMTLIASEARQVGQWPAIILAYFWASDIVGHRYGPDSPEYQRIIIDLDRQIGRVCDAVRQAGMDDRTLFVLISDHGHVQARADQHVDLLAVLRKKFALDTLYDTVSSGNYPQRHERFARARVMMSDDGDRRAVLHLRPDESWQKRPSLEQIAGFHRDHGNDGLAGDGRPFWQVLAEQIAPAVLLTAVRNGPDAVLVTDGKGRGMIERRTTGDVFPVRSRAQSYRYRVLDGPDPLGLSQGGGAALVDGQFHSSQQWLEATADGPLPDFVPQIVEYFDSPRSGDVMLFARPGWDFSARNEGGHGGVTPADMLVPMVFAGPGLARGKLHVARSVDVMPTLLEFLGRLDQRQHPCPLDGVSRWGELQSAGRPATAPEPTR